MLLWSYGWCIKDQQKTAFHSEVRTDSSRFLDRNEDQNRNIQRGETRGEPDACFLAIYTNLSTDGWAGSRLQRQRHSNIDRRCPPNKHQRNFCAWISQNSSDSKSKFKITWGPSPCLYLFPALLPQLFQQSEALPATARHLTMLWQRNEGPFGMTPSWYILQVSCGTLSAVEAWVGWQYFKNWIWKLTWLTWSKCDWRYFLNHKFCHQKLGKVTANDSPVLQKFLRQVLEIQQQHHVHRQHTSMHLGFWAFEKWTCQAAVDKSQTVRNQIYMWDTLSSYLPYDLF